jgi:hypothetical protein
MKTQDHIVAINRAIAKLSTTRGELDAVQKLGEKSAVELDALKEGESPDAGQVAMVEARLRGLYEKRNALTESKGAAEASLAGAVEAGFNAAMGFSKSNAAIDAAAKVLLPWCNGSMEAARRIALRLPAFREQSQQLYWLEHRRDKMEPEEFAPLLIQFFESAFNVPTEAAVAA